MKKEVGKDDVNCCPLHAFLPDSQLAVAAFPLILS